MTEYQERGDDYKLKRTTLGNGQEVLMLVSCLNGVPAQLCISLDPCLIADLVEDLLDVQNGKL